MKKMQSMIRYAVCLTLVSSTPLMAGANYRESLQLGDENRGHSASDLAIKEYDAAYEQGVNDTDKALALAKKGEVLAYDLKDFAGAREIVERALKLDKAQPVARVTALQVLAHCMINDGADHKGAIEILEEALDLDDVDWAQPSLAMTLGDCYRETGQFQKAIATYKDVTDMDAADDGMKGIAYLNMGITEQYSLRNPQPARSYYKKAVELKPWLKKEVEEHLSRL